MEPWQLICFLLHCSSRRNKWNLYFYMFLLHSTFTYFYFIHISYIFLPLCHSIYLCKSLFSTFRLIMTEERSKRREFLPLVFIVNCFKKPLLIRILHSQKFLAKYPLKGGIRQRGARGFYPPFLIIIDLIAHKKLTIQWGVTKASNAVTSNE